MPGCGILPHPPRRRARGEGENDEQAAPPARRTDRRASLGADRTPVRLARAEGLRAHPSAGAVRLLVRREISGDRGVLRSHAAEEGRPLRGGGHGEPLRLRAREAPPTPPAVRRLIVDLKAEYPGFNPNEIANACYVRFGRRPARKTVKRVLAEEPFPLRMMRRFPSYHEIPEPGERRRAVVALHVEGWLTRRPSPGTSGCTGPPSTGS